jgi:hypothetical protein
MILRDHTPCRVPLWGLASIGLLALAVLPGWSQAPVPAPKAEEVKKADAPSLAVKPAEPTGAFAIVLDDLAQTVQATESKAGPDGDRDRRLREVEQKLQTLLEEVRALRAGAAASAKPPRSVTVRTVPVQPAPQPAPKPRIIYSEEKRPVLSQIAQPDATQFHSVTVTHDSGAVTLSRATYRLPHAKAEALAAFLREYVKAQVMETKVEGDSLTVTTTPEAQKAIGQLIALMQEKKAAAVEFKSDSHPAARLHIIEKAVPLEEKVTPVERIWQYKLETGREGQKPQPEKEQPR